MDRRFIAKKEFNLNRFIIYKKKNMNELIAKIKELNEAFMSEMQHCRLKKVTKLQEHAHVKHHWNWKN